MTLKSIKVFPIHLEDRCDIETIDSRAVYIYSSKFPNLLASIVNRARNFILNIVIRMIWLENMVLHELEPIKCMSLNRMNRKFERLIVLIKKHFNRQ